MILQETNSENLKEEDLQWVFAACPWPFLGPRPLRFVGLNQSPKGSGLKIDLLHQTMKERRVWSEVEWGMVDLSQISRYEAILRGGIEAGTDELFWLIPDVKSLDVSLPATRIQIRRYDLAATEVWARWRRECLRDLERIHGLLSQGFDYALGKSLEPGRRLNFANVIDALYYYGYVEKEGSEGNLVRRKVGFHLATIGWNLDLIRNLSAAGCPFRDPYPELLVKLILEVLEAPYRWDDPKGRGGGALTADGLIQVLREYHKSGSNWKRVLGICEEVYAIAAGHRSKLIDLGNRLRPHVLPAGIASWDLLEIVLNELMITESDHSVIDARVLARRMIDEFKLQQMPTTRKFQLSGGELVAPAASGQEDEGGASYAGYMARRLVELSVLKNIIAPGLSMYPFYKVIAEGVDLSGNLRLQVVGVSTFSHLTDASLHSETLRGREEA